MEKLVSKPRKFVVTIFGVCGYLSLLIQWMWVATLYAPLVLHSKLRGLFIPEHQEPIRHNAVQAGGPDILWLIIGLSVTVLILGVTVLVLIRLPLAIAKTGNKVSESAVEAVLPVVTHHHTLPPKKKRQLTAQLMRSFKFILALVPMLSLIGLAFTTFSLPNDIVVLLTCFFVAVTLAWFALEYIFAKLLGVPDEQII